MITPASFHKHPIHPILVSIPIGLWVFSLICDVVYHFGSHNTFWKGIAFYSIGAGIIGALPIAVMTLVWITSPQYISLLWTEPLGRLMLAASAIWMFMGVMVMKKMINFDF